MKEDWRREAVLSDGSEVWIGSSFGVVVHAGADPAAEIQRLEDRFRRSTVVSDLEDEEALDLGEDYEAEIRRRIAAVDAGEMPTYPWEEVLERVLADLRQNRGKKPGTASKSRPRNKT